MFLLRGTRDVIFLHLRNYKSYTLTSIEEEMREADSSKSDSSGIIDQGEIS